MNDRLVVKPIPDDPRPGVPDPRVYQTWLDGQRHPHPAPRTLDEIRRSMGWANLDLCSGVTTETATLATRAGSVVVRLSRPEAPGPHPAVLYFHGGGFIGGSLKTVENPCRLLAQRATAVVVAVDYRLAPEHAYPAPLDDCWDAVVAICDASLRWGVDPSRVVVAGDSAGGNLAAACCLLDARQPQRRIAGQMLIYPVLDQRPEGQGHVPWSLSDYEILEHHELLSGASEGLRKGGERYREHYLQGHPNDDPLVSPLAHPDLRAFPPTLILTAEYDYLRVEGEVFAQRLAEAGVACRVVRYRGLDHAFFDKLGYYPQASDAVSEMAAFVQSLGPGVLVRQKAQLAFLLEIDKLKTVSRRNELADGSRRENTAEHSWHLVLFAQVLAEHGPPGVDVDHALRLCAVHDLVEIDAGDTFFWDEKGYADKAEREQAAAERLFGLLPLDQASEFHRLWREFEEGQSPEALYANAVDRLAPVLLNSHSGGRSWRENGVTATKVRQKMTAVAQASTRLGALLEALIEAALARGFLEP